MDSLSSRKYLSKYIGPLIDSSLSLPLPLSLSLLQNIYIYIYVHTRTNGACFGVYTENRFMQGFLGVSIEPLPQAWYTLYWQTWMLDGSNATSGHVGLLKGSFCFGPRGAGWGPFAQLRAKEGQQRIPDGDLRPREEARLLHVGDAGPCPI